MYVRTSTSFLGVGGGRPGIESKLLLIAFLIYERLTHRSTPGMFHRTDCLCEHVHFFKVD